MVYVCTLSKELQDKARIELNEEPEKREQNIEEIQKWIQEQPHLNIRSDDFFILRYLRGCKFSLEKTKAKIDVHFTLKTSIPEWFKKRDPQDPKLREILKLGLVLPLKNLDNNGSKVFIFRQNSYNPRMYNINDIMKAIYLISDIFNEVDEISQINGLGLIIDMKGTSVQHIIQYTPSILKNALAVWQEGNVAQNKYWNFLHAGAIYQIAYSIAKLFLKEDIKQMIKLYDSNLEKLYKTVPKEIWPKEYGGEGESIQEIIDYWLQIIDSKREWILEQDKYSVDESKRPK